MSTGKLQDFAASVITRGQVTFGDVRRLQRDYLPDGITTREEAEILVTLSDKLLRADKAWAQWLVAALARHFACRGESDPSIQAAGRAWPETLLAASPASTALGRRIARTIRRELPKLMATETKSAQQAAVSEPPPVRVEQPCAASALGMGRPIIRSDIIVRPGCAPVGRRRRKTAPPPVLPVEVWSARMMEKHQRFQLERPYF